MSFIFPKKSLFIVLVSIALILVSACSDSPSSSTPLNTKAEAPPPSGQSASPVTVSFYASPSVDIIDLKTNWFTKYVEDKFNIKINWLTTPASDSAAKQPLLLASGDYPEVFWNGLFSPSDVLKYSQQGIIIPLNDLINQYAPNLKKAIDTVPGLKGGITAPDGKIYGLPKYNYCFHCFYTGKLWVNTKWLDKYGLQMPSTTVELEHVLQVFKDNGLIPLTGSIDGANPDPTVYLMNPFVYNNGTNYFHVDNGKVEFSPVKAEWKQGLQYIHSLFAKGLIDAQAFSQNRDVVKKLITDNKIGIIAHGYSNTIIPDGSSNPNFIYWRSVPPLKGPNGVQYTPFYGNIPDSLSFVMTNKSTKEQQIALIKLLDFIWTPEGTQILDFGAEGKFWTKAKPGALGLDGKQALFDTDWDKFYAGNARQNDGWNQMGPIFQSKEWRNGGVAVPISSPNGSQTLLHLETEKNYAGYQPKEVYPGAVWIPTNEIQKYALYKTNINNFVKQWTTEFVVGTKSIDKDWDQFIKGLENLGLKQYLEISQKYMQKPFDTSDFKQDTEGVKYLDSLK